MRRLQDALPTITAAGGQLLVLTADDPTTLKRAIARHKLTLPIASVDAALWTQWGVVNPDKPELPYPTTFVIASTGAILFKEVHENYKARTSIENILAALAE